MACCHLRSNLDCKYRFINLAPNGTNPSIRSHIDGITQIETENMGSQNLTPGSTRANLQIKYALSTCKINSADELLSRHQNSAISPDCPSTELSRMMYDESGSHSTDMMSDQCNKYNYLYPLLALTKKKNISWHTNTITTVDEQKISPEQAHPQDNVVAPPKNHR